jgi:hypothetical protein
MIRAVCDVNVLISAVISPAGTPARILDLWRDERFLVVTSEPILAEFQHVAAQPVFRKRYGLTPARLGRLLQGLRRFCILTPGDYQVTGVARDPDDDKVLACAVEGTADYVVTGDDDLLALVQYQGIEILAPAAFLRVVSAVPRR